MHSLRFGLLGLRLGYYSGAFASFRASLEALQHAALFHSKPEWTARWLKAEFVDATEQERKELKHNVRRALRAAVRAPRTLRQAIGGFWDIANGNVHATVRGLASEFGVEIEAFLPDTLEEAVEDVDAEEAAEAIDKAFAMWGLHVSRFVQPGRDFEVDGEVDEKDWYHLPGLYDEEHAQHLSTVALYIAYCLVVLTGEAFSISDGTFLDYRQSWVEDVVGLASDS